MKLPLKRHVVDDTRGIDRLEPLRSAYQTQWEFHRLHATRRLSRALNRGIDRVKLQSQLGTKCRTIRKIRLLPRMLGGFRGEAWARSPRPLTSMHYCLSSSFLLYRYAKSLDKPTDFQVPFPQSRTSHKKGQNQGFSDPCRRCPCGKVEHTASRDKT
jgi:hypothetical protein